MTEGKATYEEKVILACDKGKEAEILKDILEKTKDAKDGQHQGEAIAAFWGGAVTEDGIAFVSINDTLYSWTYKSLAGLVEKLEADERVKGILFSVDSPGGMFSGAIPCAEVLASEITKPHAVYVGGLACSAGYLLASACASNGGRLFADKSAIVGSIGVEASYLDLSGWLGKMGITRRVFHSAHAGKKNLSLDTDEGKANLQKELDEDEDIFTGCIAKYRGIGQEDVYEKFGQGLTFHASEALDLGMVDEVCDGLVTACEYILASAEDGGEEDFMDFKDMKAEVFRTALEARPDLKASIEQEAVKAERERVATLRSYKALAQCAGAETVVESAIESGQSPDEALKGIIAENNKAKEALKDTQAKAAKSLENSAIEAGQTTPVVQPIADKTEADLIHDEMSAFYSK